MDRLSANFYPASEPKRFEGHSFVDEEGNQKMTEAGAYVGKASITIANAMRINDISVFLYDSGKLNLNFPDYPAPDAPGGSKSFVIPKSAEAYAAMCDVVAAARESEQGFAFTQGTYNPQLSVRGGLVDEPYADGRFSVEVGDICTLTGLSTRRAEYTMDGETHRFVAVDLPTIRDQDGKPSTYEKDGQTMYNKAFNPLVSKWTNQAGEKKSKDFGKLLNRMVLSERKQLREAAKAKEQPGLDQQVEQAKQRTGKTQSKAPAKEHEMSM